MKIDQIGRKLLEDVEGLSLTVYQDSGGEPTIGIGHLITVVERQLGKIMINDEAVDYSLGLTEQECFDLLEQDVSLAEEIINRLVLVSLNQNQFNALVSFVFNIGENQFKTSTLLKMLNNNLHNYVPEQMRRWNKDNGKVVQGLINRREKEIIVWSTPA